MTKGNGRPCKKCGTSEWDKWGHCNKCHIDNALKWQRSNPDKVRESKKKWVNSNRKKNSEQTKRWRRNNPERHRENKRRWAKNNPEKIRNMLNRWVNNNRERTRQNALRWESDNPEKAAAKKNRRRTAKTQAGGSYTAAEFKALCKQYDNRCLCCGKIKKLEFDHVIPVSKGGTSDISNGQPLCKSCNSSKGAKTTDYRTKPGIPRWIQQRLID